MSARSFESHMDWQYENKSRHLDPKSPFTAAAKGGGLQNGFASPARDSRPNSQRPFGAPSDRPNPFATPTKSQLFTPKQSPTKPSASPFRNPSCNPVGNPAFTTPRRPVDEVVFSEASGAEDSPAQGETSDYPNDTPETDRMGDITMGGTITPSKVDKTLRYQKSGLSRKHMSGKGEIRPPRDLSASEMVRRKRRQQDREYDSYLRRHSQDSGTESDASYTTRSRYRSRHRAEKKPVTRGGIFGGMFDMMEQHRTAPDNIRSWVQLGVNVFVASLCCLGLLGIVHMIRSDINAVNEGARQELRVKMATCQDNYLVNGCATLTAPAFKTKCSEWFDCMSQDPESIVRVRATLTEVAHIMNDFFGNLNLKAWGTLMCVRIVVVFANNSSGPRGPTTTATRPAQPQTSPEAFAPPTPHHGQDFMWVQVATPKAQRHALLGEDTDTDTSPPKSLKYLPPFDSTGRRSPTKRERSLSPVKYGRSSRKEYY